MKKKLFLVCVSLVWTVALMAQQIAVVSTSGTKVFRTLQEAIEGADPGSVIYLPGGGFALPDSVKITKKLTIYGIGHKSNNDNVDGVTTISGNLFFDKDSDGSALMGCYLSGGVYIGNDGNEVDNVLIRCNNIAIVCVMNDKCLGTYINQNYIRQYGHFRHASAKFTNNIIPYISELHDGFISNNIFTSAGYDNIWGGLASWNLRPMHNVSRSSVMNNIVFDARHYGDDHPFWSGSDVLASGNMCTVEVDDDSDCINVGEVDMNNVFVDYKGITPNSDFHFKDEYKQYEGKVGIYGGTGFSDAQLAPVPYIVRKIIPEHTDAEGKLNIKIRVKAGE